MTDKTFQPNVVTKSTVQQLIEAREGRELKDLLEEWYGRDGLSQAEIATKLELDESTVSRWMKQWSIPLRYGAARVRRLRAVQA